MSKIVLFDTETTGLPKKRSIGAIQLENNWPDIVSISWLVYHGLELVKKEDYIIKPEGWIIPNEVVAFHGINQEKAEREGHKLSTVMNKFMKDINGACYIIAHNLHFDKNVVMNALHWRMGVTSSEWNHEAEFCTCESSKEELKIPSKSKFRKDFKFPSMEELYWDTFKRGSPPNAHNSLRDVEVLAEIVFKRWNLYSLKGVLIE